ncbi:MAG TPA: BTAD domain-containing putative transcriptional regulator [Kribbella sp.]|nr:BTAD domain-containing putative transcriptional regulator [Kribbella sp.]
MEYGLLGPLRVLDDSGVELRLSAAKPRTLLARLLVDRGRPVSADRVTDTLWGDEPPASAANLVHGYVRDLRRLLGAGAIVTGPDGYCLDLRRDSVDADRFEELVRAARYEDALALWRGRALPEWAELPWARSVATRLEEERLAALESRLRQDIDEGRAAAVAGELAGLVHEHPTRERLRALQVKALYASGRQAEALEAYAAARRFLIAELGIEPGPELHAIEAAVLAQDPALVSAVPRPEAAPPVPVIPLTGRERDLATLRSSLDTSRLVTLTGPGGVGKTALAVEFANTLGTSQGSVWYVALTQQSAGGDVATVVARALRLAEDPGHEVDLVCTYLSRCRGLLVIDNCEHVVDAAAELATAVLASCPDVRVLTTSREPLHAAGEQVVRLDGLEEPAATALFMARARAVAPAAQLAHDAARNIVRKLDGIPLALELAAARSVSLTLDQLDAGLARPLDLLEGEARAGDPRHRTMRSVIDWSHSLLDLRDREVLAALSVFVGAFDIEAARAVAGRDALAAVEHLLARSMLTRDRDVVGKARYRFLDPVRQYAEEHAPSGARALAGRHHLEYHAGLAARIDHRIRTVEASAWAAVSRAGTADLRAAVANAIAERSTLTGQLVADLYWPWFLDGRLTELRSWATNALVIESDSLVRGRLLRALASAALAQGDTTVAIEAARRQLDIAERHQHEELAALARNLLGMAAWAQGDPAAVAHHRAAIDHARRADSPWTLALVMAIAGRTAHTVGDHDAGAALLLAATDVAEELAEPMVLGSALDYRAHAELSLGRTTEATELAARSLAAYAGIGYQEGLASASTLAAHLAVLAGRYDDAETLLDQAFDLCRRLRHPGGTASVLEARAVLDVEKGDHRQAAADLAEARLLRRHTGTTIAPALRDQLARVQRTPAPG